MELDQALPTFIAESRELLEDMERALLEIERAQDKGEMINAIFRAAHTIKGSSGLFGLDHIVAFTHAAESVLDSVRGGRLAVTDKLVSLLLSCCDHIGALINAVEAGNMSEDAALAAKGKPLAEQLHACLEDAPTPVLAAEAPLERIGGSAVDGDHWLISLRFGRDVLKNGMDPLSFIRYLETLGEIVGIVTCQDALPDAQEMDPECCYLGFEIGLKSNADKATIENVFEFVRDDCQLRIVPPASKISEYMRVLEEIPMDTTRIGELLVRCGIVTEQELASALDEQAHSGGGRKLGEILVEQHAVHPDVIDAALTKQTLAKEAHAQESRSVRVDADKLDGLINLIGELIIAGACAGLVARRSQLPELRESMSKVQTLVEDVRDSALQLRMVKIGATFSRFQRVVRDAARETGKDIDLVITGEDAELDKTMVEKIGDPLTHLVRNAVDHGIEPAEVRLAAGKPAKGTVRLDAYHDSGSVVIAVSDDGGGLKRDRILAKAIERGLVEPGHNLSDADIYNLIFEPGFSTAESITNLSGRGVGLDVVKRNISALRGSVDIRTEEGVGTMVSVRLPLTLAIIDGFLVGVGNSVFAIPLDMVEECVAYSAEPGHDYTSLRGQMLPLIRLREMFAVEGAASRRENIVVVRHAGQKAGLVVDTLLGEFQTVIKPLGKLFGNVHCISGSTILGSGDVALILDIPALVQEAGRAATGRTAVRPALAATTIATTAQSDNVTANA